MYNNKSGFRRFQFPLSPEFPTDTQKTTVPFGGSYGDKILIPAIPTPRPTSKPGEESSSVNYPININTASQEELEELPGIGPSLAAEIIAYREKNGAFTDPEKLKNVSGIGPSTYAKLEELITIGD